MNFKNQDGTHNNDQALCEGWDIFDVDGRLQLQRLDCPSDIDFLKYDEPKFVSDTTALIFVSLKAHGGSKYHESALDLIGTGVYYREEH